jgi:V/A-type H+-transporting ATPase subunit E
MSLETVVEDIREEAREEAEAIRADADERAEEILEAAREDAETIRESAEREVDNEIERERKQRVSSATLEAKQTRLEARRDVLQEVHERLEERVADLSGDRRESLTRELLVAAAREFEDDETVTVHCRPEDAEMVDSLLSQDRFERFERAGEVDCLGGVVVEGDRSRVRVNNTFDSVLEDLWEDELREISQRLFEE